MKQKETVIITGSSRGLGMVVSKNLMQDGYNVIGISKNRHQNVSELEKYSKKYKVFYKHHYLDLSTVTPKEIEEILGDATQYDHLIICHGTMVSNEILSLSEDELLQAFRINTLAPFIISQFLAKGWVKKPNINRSITYISSVSCAGAATLEAAYGMSKRAAEHLMQSLARLGIEANKSFRTNVIRPGLLDTEKGLETQKNRPDVVSRIPLGLTGCTEVSSLVKTIMLSKSITGQRYDINGGRTFSNI